MGDWARNRNLAFGCIKECAVLPSFSGQCEPTGAYVSLHVLFSPRCTVAMDEGRPLLPPPDHQVDRVFAADPGDAHTADPARDPLHFRALGPAALRVPRAAACCPPAGRCPQGFSFHFSSMLMIS